MQHKLTAQEKQELDKYYNDNKHKSLDDLEFDKDLLNGAGVKLENNSSPLDANFNALALEKAKEESTLKILDLKDE